MRNFYTKNNVKLAKDLRKNMTPQERKLWYDFLKELDVGFLRQKTIGNYIVDFYCPAAKLVVELDGSQHYLDEGVHDDAERDAYMSSLGIKVMRFSNADINCRFENVKEQIFQYLKSGQSSEA